MDDIVDGIFWIICVLAGVALIVYGAMSDDNAAKQDRQDSRYEKCIDNGMQWVDNNCVTK